MRKNIVLVTLLVLSLLGSTVWAASDDPTAQHSVAPANGEPLALAGLDGEVFITYDAYGIPQIYASTSHDLFMAQGVVHAKDRWWQMEWFRHQGAGRLSELMGPNLASTDSFLRTLGLNRNAQVVLEATDADTLAALEAYAQGVNAWIEGKEPAEVAVEYQFIELLGGDTVIEPWTPFDSILLMQTLALDQEQSDLQIELIRDGVQTQAGPLGLAILNPPYPYDSQPLIGEPGRETTSRPAPLANDTAIPTLERTFTLNLAGWNTVGGFSNSWAVSGALTETGLPFVANDPHIGIQQPAIWYQIGLHCNEVSADCPFDVYGFSLASVPGVVIGHNANIAWGLTNAGGDTIDIYKLEINPENPLQYMYEGEWLDMEVVEETITVAGADPIVLPVRITRFGPIFNELVGMEAPMAFRWVASGEPVHSIPGLLSLNQATNMEAFRTSIAMIGAPSLNVIYGDVEGNIGVMQMGRIPIRPEGNNGGLPVAGVDASTEWAGFVDQIENPQLFNPDSGYIVAANNVFFRPEDYPVPIYSAVYDFGYRSERIENLILANPTHSIDTMIGIQTDTYNGAANIVIPVLQTMTFEDDSLNDYVAWLADWDYIETVDSPQAALFNALWKYINLYGLDELLPTGELSGDALEGYLISQMLTGAHPLWANADLGADAADRDLVVTAALTDAIAYMTETFGSDRDVWQWGEMHHVKFQHNPLGRLPAGQNIGLDIMLQDIYRTFNRTVPFPGNNLTVNRGSWAVSNEDYNLSGVIASMRMIVDLSDLDNSRFIIPMGQSGDPFSPHYDDQLEFWATGQYLTPGFSAESVEGNSADEWLLIPE